MAKRAKRVREAGGQGTRARLSERRAKAGLALLASERKCVDDGNVEALS